MKQKLGIPEEFLKVIIMSMKFLTSCKLMDDLTDHVYQDGLAFPSDGRERDCQSSLWFLASAVLMCIEHYSN